MNKRQNRGLLCTTVSILEKSFNRHLLRLLPYRNGYCQYPVLGLHIHQGRSCSGNREDPFADAGDLPPVFVNEGMAWSAVILTKFTIKEILGRVVILHSMPDDFHSQPSGNSGEKIACGIIRRNSPKTLD